MLPVLMVVCPTNVEESNSVKVATTIRLNRVAERRGEFRFDIINLPFQMFTTPLFRNSEVI